MKRTRSLAGMVTLLVIVAALFSVLGWSAHALLSPPEQRAERIEYALTTTSEAVLGRELKLAAQADWTAPYSLSGKKEGTLTTIPTGRQARIQDGEVLYTVDLEPVFALRGAVPSFRDMAQGMNGDDIAQLQSYLFERYESPLKPDGNYGPATESLVKKWQKDNGIEPTGVISMGQIVFVPHLPANISWSDDVYVGTHLTASTQLFKVFSDAPTFTLPLPEGQLRAAHEGQHVHLSYEGHQWQARIATIISNSEERTLVATLEAIPGEERICGDTCDLIPPAGLKGIEANVEIIPEEKGIVVPTHAIRVDASGQTVLVDESGTQLPVSVGISVGGRTIVTGVDSGIKIRVWDSSIITSSTTEESSEQRNSDIHQSDQGSE